MSYDIYLKDPVTKEVIEVDTPHFIDYVKNTRDFSHGMN